MFAKFAGLISSLIFSFSIVAATSSHNMHANHPHKHDSKCGHATEKFAGKTIYAHEGHDHFAHGDHVDEENLTIHKDHSHVHGSDCGHKMVEHDGHKDYLHDGHTHHVHGDHVHEDHKI
jgi:hypothetical protein